jgi:hypothetical protein
MARVPNLTDVYHQVAGWGLGAVAALAFALGLRRRLRGLWPLVFLVFLATASTLSSMPVASMIEGLRIGKRTPINAWCLDSVQFYIAFVAIGAGAILVAAAWDAFRRAPTDALHWTGVAAWLAIAIMQIVVYVSLM